MATAKANNPWRAVALVAAIAVGTGFAGGWLVSQHSSDNGAPASPFGTVSAAIPPAVASTGPSILEPSQAPVPTPAPPSPAATGTPIASPIPSPTASVASPIASPTPSPEPPLAEARVDGETWLVNHEVTSSTWSEALRGDVVRRVYLLAYGCSAPPCGGTVASDDPYTLEPSIPFPFDYANGTYRIRTVGSERCDLPNGFVVGDGYTVVSRASLTVGAAQWTNGAWMATALEGTVVRDGKPTAAGASHGCPPWRVDETTSALRTNGPEAALETSPDWSGYVIQVNAGQKVDTVEATWIQPTVACGSTVHERQNASFWVGIDGAGSPTVEQIGTAGTCDGLRDKAYHAWWEMYPDVEIPIPMAVRPGDVMHGRVTAVGSSFTLYLQNETAGGAPFETTHFSAEAKRLSAEWVAEATTLGLLDGSTHLSELPDFGYVRFSNCRATIDGNPAAFADGSWLLSPVVMANKLDLTHTKAEPSAISTTKDAFTVKWRAVGP